MAQRQFSIGAHPAPRQQDKHQYARHHHQQFNPRKCPAVFHNRFDIAGQNPFCFSWFVKPAFFPSCMP
jgi:hypothetical protein